MAKKDITLTAEQWAVVFKAVREAPAGQAVETQWKQYRLLEALREPLLAGQTTVSLQPSQCTMIDGMLGSPVIPWRVEGLPLVWKIREAFGFRPPTDADFDEEEGP